ncbi:MAG TPA: CRTAC1 family protein [Thermoanaerobaculia bacterium]|nr:CRTAC1 family protein [Thermoanaerobaculia bacterium]
MVIRKLRFSLLMFAACRLSSFGMAPDDVLAQEAGAPKAPFVDVTERSGILWKHETGAFGQRWLPETLGPGVIVLDANGDGMSDLLFVNGRNFPDRPGPAATPSLYLNRGSLRFEDATHQAGLDFSAFCLGGAAADYDNDGRPDIYLSCLGQDFLLHNDGGRFSDVSRKAGLSQACELGASAAFFDADRDGHVDIFVTRYVDWTPETDKFCSADGKTKSYCVPIVYKSVSNHYYRNLGDGRFEEQTSKAGLANPSKGLGVVPFDVDADGWPDLAVASDTQPNLLFHNKGNGTFEEVGLSAGLAFSVDGQVRGGMGIDAGDYNRTGRPSVVITYYTTEMTGLYRNEGNMFLLDIAPGAEIGRRTRPYVGWGCFFFDYDLDGWLDLLVANGHLDDSRSKLYPPEPHAQPTLLFRNQGNGEFVEVGAGSDLAVPIVARGAAFADLDGDGDLDLVLAANGGSPKVLENRGPHGNWLRLALQGKASNRDGLGALIKITAKGGTQTWYVHSGGSYLSQSQVEPTFGLGDVQTVDEIVIQWPSGTTQRLTHVAANQRLKVVEPDAKPVAPSSSPGRREAF